VQLVADRFVCDEDGRTIDAATGAPVVLRISDAGLVAEQLQWTLRCDAWRAWQHRAIAPLVDFGLLGERSRFEAWLGGVRLGDLHESGRGVSGGAVQFLRTVGLTIGADLAPEIYAGMNGPIVVPDAGTGYPDGSSRPVDVVLPLESRGLRFVSRPAVAALAEMIEQADGRRSRIAMLWGRPGSGKRTIALELARIARINGFVPIASHLLDAPFAHLWRGRSLFILAGSSLPSGWSAALQSMLQSPRPHVVLLVGENEHRGIDGVALTRMEPDALVGAVYPAVDDPVQLRRVRRAALGARGLPGRFVRLVWRSRHRGGWHDVPMPRRGLRVAESSIAYGIEPAPVHDQPASCEWPAPAELGQLRRRLRDALTLVANGRYGPGVRQLRQVVGSLARRDDWSSAADGALALAACLLGRGRPREAQAALDDARRHVGRTGCDPLLVDVATLSGEAWIDLSRLDEAETVLAAAAATARGLGERERASAASQALARCLYWRGQYAEAKGALGDVDENAAGNWLTVRPILLAARIALAESAFERATMLTTRAVAATLAGSDARARAAAAYCAGLVHAAVGDLEAADRDLVDALAAARTAHDPLRAVRARLLQVEVDRRRGRSGAAAARLARMARLVRGLPPLLKARAELLAAFVADPGAGHVGERAGRQIGAAGARTLAIYVGGTRAAADPFESLASEVVAIVHACQTAEDEAIVLRDVCVRVRRQIHAAGVAFVTGPGQRFAMLASDGPRLDVSSAERAVTAGITIAPHRVADRVEAAVPVRYGGAPIGALAARWTLGSTDDLRRASATLEMAAAAAAPIVSALLGRRDAPDRIGPEILGVTPAMRDLRMAIDRAGPAPFPVLIEGESGSGKELVARAIHRASPRRDRSLCPLNCAALPDDLVEAELFGHARGAFTNAVAERAGVFEEAHGGTLFLDEIGELSPRAQAKVLRVLQEGELRRVGENISRRVDARIIAATNRDLRREIDAGRFRLDLWYRLDVIRILVPPLRDRREDIVVLAEHFWREAAARVNGRATLGRATLAALGRYDWPGNVRELQNVLAALAVRSPRRGVVPPTALPPQFAGRGGDEAWRFCDARRAFEERFVRAALVRSGGHRGRAAAELGVSRQGLTKLMTRLGIASDGPAAHDAERAAMEP